MNGSPRRRLGPRVGAAGVAFGAVLVLGACQAAGGGYIGDPLGGGPDSFSIQLIGGADNGYTRGGYIEGGNVPVESSK